MNEPEPFADWDDAGLGHSEELLRGERGPSDPPRVLIWLASVSLIVVACVFGWAELREFTVLHHRSPEGFWQLTLWIVGLGP